MFVLVVGPSSVGKSALCERAEAADEKIRHYNLDAVIAEEAGVASASSLLVSEGADAFLGRSKGAYRRLRDVHSDVECGLVDVGAGSLEAAASGAWVASELSICVYAPAETVYRRDKIRDQRPFTQFEDQEYNACRMAIYEACSSRVDIGDSPEDEAYAIFLGVLTSLVES